MSYNPYYVDSDYYMWFPCASISPAVTVILLKGGHGIFPVCSDLRACYTQGQGQALFAVVSFVCLRVYFIVPVPPPPPPPKGGREIYDVSPLVWNLRAVSF